MVLKSASPGNSMQFVFLCGLTSPRNALEACVCSRRTVVILREQTQGGNELDGVGILELLGEWMFRQCYARRPFFILQGGLKDQA